MSAGLIAVVVIGATLVLGGLAALLVVIGAARINGPDTAKRDPYGLAGRESDAPAVDLDLALAREAAVDVTPDGTHDNLGVGAQQLAGEVLWLYEQFPEAVALDQGDDFYGPPIVPGRDTTP